MSKKVPISQVFKRLFIGDNEDAKHFKGVTINVLDYFPKRHLYLHRQDGQNPYRGEDDYQTFERLVTIIRDNLWKGEKVLVYCRLGLHYAPTVVLYFLMRMGMSVEEAKALIKSKRPDPRLIFSDRWFP